MLALGLVVVGLSPAAAHAQATPSSGSTVDVLVREIRLLRQALEKQSATAARAQLLIGRLTLQDQRTARARQSVERLESELANAERERDQTQAAVRETAESVGRVTDEEGREQLERQARMLRARLAESQADISRAQNRLLEAKRSLEAESSDYEDLEARLRELERELQGGG
jgi:chromosome segregation ATPase